MYDKIHCIYIHTHIKWLSSVLSSTYNFNIYHFTKHHCIKSFTDVSFQVRCVLADTILADIVYWPMQMLADLVHWPTQMLADIVHWPTQMLADIAYWPTQMLADIYALTNHFVGRSPPLL